MDIVTTCATKYSLDVSQEVVKEVIYLKTIHCTNIGEEQLKPLDLLNQITNMKLDQRFPNICVALRILLTIPASVAFAECSFSKLKLIKNHLLSTMSQGRLVNLARLSIESNLAKSINFDSVIKNFAQRKVRKAFLNPQ